MATIDEIKQKYLGDDAFSKAANTAYHALKNEAKGKNIPAEKLNRIKGLEIARAYAGNNSFENADIIYQSNAGWKILVKKYGHITATEAQALARDLLKAVAAVKKAPAIKK